MQLGVRGHYAVLAMSDLARREAGTAVPLARIAEEQKIALPYLGQLFRDLRRAGLVRAVRGVGGGYSLARSAEDIRISEIVFSVGEPVSITQCGRGGKNPLMSCRGDSTRCLTHNLWAVLAGNIANWLHSVKLSEVAAGKISAPPFERR